MIFGAICGTMKLTGRVNHGNPMSGCKGGTLMEYRLKKCTVRCEDCEFYQYDPELDIYSCQQNLDQDEAERMSYGGSSECPFFRFYDEYQSTRRQI